jgi:GTP-binding protein
VEDLQSLRREIDLYDERLSRRPWCIVANKMDLPAGAENLPVLRDRFAPVPVIPISANEGEGITGLKEQLGNWLTAAERNNAAPVESTGAGDSD